MLSQDDLESKVGGFVLITGASSGIGQACALYLDKIGFDVFAGVRREADAERLRAQASARLRPVFLDVTDTDSIAQAAETIAEAAGPAGLAGLVNNAGIAVGCALEFIPLDDLRRQLEVNVVGQVAVTQAMLPLLRQAGGRIVNIGSISGVLATPFLGAYSASKFALEALSDALRVELQPWGIKTIILEPGSIKTNIWDKSVSEGRDLVANLPPEADDLYGEAIESVFKMAGQAEKRGIEPQAVAEVVANALTLAQPKTRYVIGEDAKIQARLARFLPDRARDKALTKILRLPPPPAPPVDPAPWPKIAVAMALGLGIGGVAVRLALRK